jgi:hypothetical protein
VYIAYAAGAQSPPPLPTTYREGPGLLAARTQATTVSVSGSSSGELPATSRLEEPKRNAFPNLPATGPANLTNDPIS